LWSIPVDSRGEITRDQAFWTQPKQIPMKPSPLLVEDTLYVITDGGVLSCIDREDGNILWSARVGGNYSASPLLADGKIYLCSQEGHVTVVTPSRQGFRKLADNELDGQLMASPVAMDRALFIRSDQNLYCITTPP
jgi:outer membrane protein assembly factor BamB